MITINLLPAELRPIKRTPLPHIASLALLLLTVAAVGHLWWSKQGEIREQEKIYAQKEAAYNALKEIEAKYEDLIKKKEQLQARVEVIREILKDRTIWSEQLHILTSLMPENVWLSGIRETTKRVTETVMQEVPASGQRAATPPAAGAAPGTPGGAPTEKKAVKVTVTKPFLEVQGYARPTEGGGDEVNPFIRSLQEDPRFSKKFSLDRTTLSFKDDPQGNRVRSFTLEFEILSPTEEKEDASGTDGAKTAGGTSNV